jgi:hypothetical protein
VPAYIGVSLLLGRLSSVSAACTRPITYAKGKEEGERIQRRSYETDKEENKRVKYRQIQPWS